MAKKIDDLAIILSSSNEAYCSDCFKCCKCHENIQDLRYAKTKKGLFCLHCHEKLLAKRRTYDEKKRKLLEKKNLPKIPQITDDDVESPSLNPIMKSRQTDDDMKKSSSSLEIPKRSVNRPRSAIRDAQIMKENGLVKSTSDSIITHYLDVDETKENESKDVIDKSSSRKTVLYQRSNYYLLIDLHIYVKARYLLQQKNFIQQQSSNHLLEIILSDHRFAINLRSHLSEVVRQIYYLSLLNHIVEVWFWIPMMKIALNLSIF